jgi:hypothetical protein
MIVASPGLEVLHVNAVHERMFGGARQLGDPAAVTFPDLGVVGVMTAIEQVLRTGEPATTPPVPLGGDGGSVLFASVPAHVPGHASAVLTLGMRDTGAEECVTAARELAEKLADLAH